MRGHYDRTRLPTPGEFYYNELLPIIGRGEWRDAPCCFHSDKHPSLRLNFRTGAFRCMTCGAKGMDVLSFAMQRYGMSFVEAAQELGAWREAS